jgi:hypothetical protein
MKKALLVNIEQSLNQLASNVPNFLLLKLLSLLTTVSHQLEEILFDILKHKIGFIDDPDHLFEFDNIRMVHFPKSFYL